MALTATVSRCITSGRASSTAKTTRSRGIRAPIRGPTRKSTIIRSRSPTRRATKLRSAVVASCRPTARPARSPSPEPIRRARSLQALRCTTSSRGNHPILPARAMPFHSFRAGGQEFSRIFSHLLGRNLARQMTCDHFAHIILLLCSCQRCFPRPKVFVDDAGPFGSQLVERRIIWLRRKTLVGKEVSVGFCSRFSYSAPWLGRYPVLRLAELRRMQGEWALSRAALYLNNSTLPDKRGEVELG